MTLVRKLALKISDRVVRYASPGCKEWAEGLSVEVAFIRSDWAALRWALGSTRILLDRSEAPMNSLSDVTAFMQERVKNQARSWIYSATFPFIIWYEWGQQPYYPWELALASSLILVMQNLQRRRRLKTYVDGDARTCAMFYKKELEAFCSRKRWIAIPITLLCVVQVLKHWTHPVIAMVVGIAFLGSVAQSIQSLPTSRMRLERLNALLAVDPQVTSANRS
jgi:hypothetical protein